MEPQDNLLLVWQTFHRRANILKPLLLDQQALRREVIQRWP